MARAGRKRKPGKREPNGQPQRERNAIPDWIRQTRLRVFGEDCCANGDAGSLIGAWFLKGLLKGPGDAPGADERRKEAATAYAKAIDDMSMLLGIAPHKDTLSQFLPRGRAIDISPERAKTIRARYNERFEVLRGEGQHVAKSVRAAIQNDTGANREYVLIGLQALVDAGLT
jgi:hypothetical protein